MFAGSDDAIAGGRVVADAMFGRAAPVVVGRDAEPSPAKATAKATAKPAGARILGQFRRGLITSLIRELLPKQATFQSAHHESAQGALVTYTPVHDFFRPSPKLRARPNDLMLPLLVLLLSVAALLASDPDFSESPSSPGPAEEEASPDGGSVRNDKSGGMPVCTFKSQEGL